MNRTPESNKTIHILSSAFKATFTWHNMRTLQVLCWVRWVKAVMKEALLKFTCYIYQECREACGGQGLKTENRVGHLKGEFDVQSTFEGDNNVLMQQVSLLTGCLYFICFWGYLPYDIFIFVIFFLDQQGSFCGISGSSEKKSFQGFRIGTHEQIMPCHSEPPFQFCA